MQRQLKYGANTVLAVIMFTAILVLINVLPRQIKVLNVFGMRVPLQKEFDLTENKKWSLSDQSVKTLEKLKTPVKAIAFVQTGQEAQLEDLLKRYSFASTNFTYRIEDPERSPLTAKKYNVKQPFTLILDANGQTESVTLPYSNEAAATEAKITSALIRILNPKKSVLYFVSGHGELDLNDPTQGLGALRTDLEGESYVIKPLQLFNTKEIPPDASAVVVAGPTKDYFPAETDVLDKYVKRGGRILWLANLPFAVSQRAVKSVEMPNISKFLLKYGIRPNGDLVVSTAMLNIQNRMRILIPAGTKYESHPITQGFREATFYQLAQSVRIDKAPTGASVVPLVYTNEQTIEYADPLKAAPLVVEAQDPSAGFDPKKDKKGQALLGVAGTYPVEDKQPAVKASPSPAAAEPKADDKPKAEGRIVVFGNAAFVSGQMLQLGGNGDLALNAIAWLAERSEQISIQRPSEKPKPLTVDEETKRRLTWFGLPLMPCLVAVLGIMVHMFLKRN